MFAIDLPFVHSTERSLANEFQKLIWWWSGACLFCVACDDLVHILRILNLLTAVWPTGQKH
jgi:hypothetical protein